MIVLLEWIFLLKYLDLLLSDIGQAKTYLHEKGFLSVRPCFRSVRSVNPNRGLEGGKSPRYYHLPEHGISVNQ